MTHDDLPDRWKKKIVAWIRILQDDHREKLCAGDFPVSHSLGLRFDDGSMASFKHAILIEAPELDEAGIFTEHCGYHIFPLSGTHVARIEA